MFRKNFQIFQRFIPRFSSDSHIEVFLKHNIYLIVLPHSFIQVRRLMPRVVNFECFDNFWSISSETLKTLCWKHYQIKKSITSQLPVHVSRGISVSYLVLKIFYPLNVSLLYIKFVLYNTQSVFKQQ